MKRMKTNWLNSKEVGYMFFKSTCFEMFSAHQPNEFPVNISLNCSTLYPYSWKLPFLSETEQTTLVSHNKLLTRITRMPKQWKLSVNVYVEEFKSGDINIMNFAKSDPSSTHNILSIGLQAVTNKFTFALKSLDLTSNLTALLLKYTSMEFSCFKFNNSYRLLWDIDRRRQYYGPIEDPMEIKNVLVFISRPSQASLNGKIKHLKFKEESSRGSFF